MISDKKELSPSFDPWEAMHRNQQFGRNTLTSIEFTVTNLCNLRCEHCAVGDVLTMTERADKLPLSLLLHRLDQIEHLDTLSITGGEPMYNMTTIKDYIVPLLSYAQKRGAKTQINSNLTLDLARYDLILPYLDVLHISFNYINAEDFYKVAYVHASHPVAFSQAEKTFNRMVENTSALAKNGVFVSAESLISEHTQHKLVDIHHLIAKMGCKRHEVHPLYPSDFAKHMRLLSLDELRLVYRNLLNHRNPDLWILFGTLPYYACNTNQEDLQLIRDLAAAENVTVRNDPDGHNRLNTNIFTGEVIVTDFGDGEVEALGNIQQDSFATCFERWQQHPRFQRFNCYCPQSQCVGPHLLVANTYYPDVDFRERKGITIFTPTA